MLLPSGTIKKVLGCKCISKESNMKSAENRWVGKMMGGGGGCNQEV